ncbi:MAG: histidinol dehydrogenase, partial [Spirochaetales bacterium]|nr:histidinol dehydrogenase [Spirochaetales bacterium]
MKYFNITNDKLSDELRQFLSDEDKDNLAAEKTVLDIKKDFLERRFTALADYSKRFDKFNLTADNYKVTQAEIDALAAKCDPKLAASLEIAINRVRAFHENQKDNGFTYTDPDGNKMGQKVTPLEAIAVYVPGGRALYPSTVYMTVIPAIVAGVKRIVLISPPRTFVESPEVA